MPFLILTVLTIALFGASLLAMVSYLPISGSAISAVESALISAYPKIEQAFTVTTHAGAGVIPPVTADPDGGFGANFGWYLHFPPSAPPGFKWTYGIHANDGTYYANTAYVCLVNTGGAVDRAVFQGIRRSVAMYSPVQVMISGACDPAAAPQQADPLSGRVNVTLYLSAPPAASWGNNE